jgi:hypothetical protein
MDIIKAIAPATVVLALTLMPAPASAQARPRGNGGYSGTAVERGSGGGGGARTQARQDVRGGGGGAAVRGGGGAMAGGVVRGGPAVRGGVIPRGGPARGGELGPHGGVPRGAVRGPAPRQQYYPPRVQAPRGYVVPRYYGRPSYGPAYRPRFERPYYVFRPRRHIEFGLWLGFGVPYPRAYIVGYPPPVYGYYGGRFGVVPGARYYGGISFDIAPDYAPVYVDGTYVGVASDFGPYAQPLTLVPGLHRVMISVGGYRPISWNVTVVAGQVIPFRGSMLAY